jgi:hypothetical protein
MRSFHINRKIIAQRSTANTQCFRSDSVVLQRFCSDCGVCFHSDCENIALFIRSDCCIAVRYFPRVKGKNERKSATTFVSLLLSDDAAVTVDARCLSFAPSTMHSFTAIIEFCLSLCERAKYGDCVLCSEEDNEEGDLEDGS